MKLIWANFQLAINRQSLDKSAPILSSQFSVPDERSSQNPSKSLKKKKKNTEYRS